MSSPRRRPSDSESRSASSDITGDRDDRGTLFVVQGSMRVLHADAFLVPTDSRGSVTESWSWIWEPKVPARRRVLDTVIGDLVTNRTTVLRAGAVRTGRTVVAANVAVTDGSKPMPWLEKGLRAALDGYGQWLADHDVVAEHERAMPLLAMPMIGTAHGGLANVRGSVVKRILTVVSTHQAGERPGQRPFDVVLVCRERADYSAVQATRREQSADVGAWLEPVVRSARAGQLGVMFGAGASMGVGMPRWNRLLELLLEDLGSNDLTPKDLVGIDAVDAASLLVDLALKEGKDAFAKALGRHVSTTKCSLVHALIASLQPAVAITTNYDRGYENAVSAIVDGGPAVLPWQQPESADQPVLLKLHGDVKLGSVVLSREDFVTMQAHRRPLGGLLQERMMVGHLLTVGTTMSDPTLVLAAEEVTSLLHRTMGRSGPHGTVVMTENDPARRSLLSRSFYVAVANTDAVDVSVAARRVEILLDVLAMHTSRSLAYLLDAAYDELRPAGRKDTVSMLRTLQRRASRDGGRSASSGAREFDGAVLEMLEHLEVPSSAL